MQATLPRRIDHSKFLFKKNLLNIMVYFVAFHKLG